MISGIIEKGVFVELLESKVEGLVTFDSMGDMFTVPTSRMKAKSRLSGDEITMGQKVRCESKRLILIQEEQTWKWWSRNKWTCDI